MHLLAIMTRMPVDRFALSFLSVLVPVSAFSQAVAPPAAPGPFQLPTVVVTAQKEPADVRTLPVSVSVAGQDTLWNAGAVVVSDAARYSPNTYFNEFSARKLSNARMRGVGSSPANPGVTTFIDGVPQLNANTSSMELLDVDQLEFVRGPQGALFGRNVLGGLVNIVSVRPSITRWSGSAYVPLGNASARELRTGVSGPLVNGRLGLAASMVYGERDGFTRNDITGRTIDDRSAFSGKAQLLWTPAPAWEARAIVSGERARDGDYALHDLAALRSNPFHAARDFEGFTHRDVVNTTVLARREGARVVFSTTTGFVQWKTEDATDLDYSPLPLVTRNNAEDAFQFTQEVRLASAARPAAAPSGGMALRWQTGVFLFTQNYDQHATNQFAPFLLSPLLPFAVSQTSPQAALDDVGLGVYGQATTTLRDRIDLTLGARFDYENKEGRLATFSTPPIAPPTEVIAEESFTNVTPQFAVAFRPAAGRTLYASVSRGFKAGGFNPASPPGFAAYGEEHTWHVEGGEDAGGWPRIGQRGRVLHRLGRPPAEPAGSGRARAVLHRQRRRRDQRGRRGRAQRARDTHGSRREPDDRHRRVRRVRLHACALRRRQPVERARRRRERAPQRAGVHRQRGRAVVARRARDDHRLRPRRSRGVRVVLL